MLYSQKQNAGFLYLLSNTIKNIFLQAQCPWPTVYQYINRSFRRRIHPGSLVHLLFSNGWPAT